MSGGWCPAEHLRVRLEALSPPSALLPPSARPFTGTSSGCTLAFFRFLSADRSTEIPVAALIFSRHTVLSVHFHNFALNSIHLCDAEQKWHGGASHEKHMISSLRPDSNLIQCLRDPC